MRVENSEAREAFNLGRDIGAAKEAMLAAALAREEGYRREAENMLVVIAALVEQLGGEAFVPDVLFVQASDGDGHLVKERDIHRVGWRLSVKKAIGG